ncbi:MAG: hypothetical protein ACI89L_002086 [Phycisphaerales bacterium]|jgi:hypothetical protein
MLKDTTMPEPTSNPDHTPWLVIPSANEANCARTLPVWRAMGYRIAVLQDAVRFAVEADAVIEADEYHGWAWAVNRLCREAVPDACRVVVAAGDDMLPDPTRSGPQIAGDYLQRFPDGLGIMQPTGDGYLLSDTYCGSPWFGRAWIEQAFGGRGPIPTGYRHNWADMELHWVAKGLGCQWQREDLTQRHEHFAREGGTPPPAYWSKNAAGFDRADCERFIERAWARFPGCESVARHGVPSASYDHEAFEREYRSIAEVHLFSLTDRCAWDARRRMREAMDLCAQCGWARVAFYGNGAHTEAVWDVVADSSVQPVVILDDAVLDEHENHERFGVPVCRPEAAAGFGVQAVVLSANSVEDELIFKAQRLGLPVVRLYGEVSPRVVGLIDADESPLDAAPARAG